MCRQMIRELKSEMEAARSRKSKAENSASVLQSKADGARLAAAGLSVSKQFKQGQTVRGGGEGGRRRVTSRAGRQERCGVVPAGGVHAETTRGRQGGDGLGVTLWQAQAAYEIIRICTDLIEHVRIAPLVGPAEQEQEEEKVRICEAQVELEEERWWE
eukprot:352976-Hanusia_phi.AAC.2